MKDALNKIEYYKHFKKYLDKENAEKLASMIGKRSFAYMDWSGIVQLDMQMIPFEHISLFENSSFKSEWFNYMGASKYMDKIFLNSMILRSVINKTDDCLRIISLFMDEEGNNTFFSLVSNIIKTAEQVGADDILMMIADGVCTQANLKNSTEVMVNICEACYHRNLTDTLKRILDNCHQEIFDGIHLFQKLQTAVCVYEIYYPDYDNEELSKILYNFWNRRYWYETDIQEQLEYAFTLGIKTSVLNNIVPFFGYNISGEQKNCIIDMLNDDVIIYAHSMSEEHWNRIGEIIPLLQLKNKNVSINIDESDQYSSTLYWKDINVKKLFSTYMIVSEHPLKDNAYLKYLAKKDDEILYFILDKLSGDDNMSDMIEICINVKNLKALDYIAVNYHKQDTCE